MNRSQRAELARQTVAIVDRGEYALPDGRMVTIRPAVEACLAATRDYDAAAVAQLVASLPPALGSPAVIDVRNETTLAGVARLLAEGPGPVAALNFASAKNPGGGFLGGSQAQEESLARSSALYASQLRAEAFYRRHRAGDSCLYTDAVVLSPGCPIIRDDGGNLLAQPVAATFLTCAAPNAGALARNAPADVARIPDTLRRRAAGVLAVAAANGCDRLVLGAWGCGVFRNDPATVAAAFAELLHSPAWRTRFRRVAFAVFDPVPAGDTVRAFAAAFGGK